MKTIPSTIPIGMQEKDKHLDEICVSHKNRGRMSSEDCLRTLANYVTNHFSIHSERSDRKHVQFIGSQPAYCKLARA